MTTRSRTGVLVGILAALITSFVVVSLVDAHSPDPDPIVARTIVGDADFPVSPLALPDGSLLYAERRTGRIRKVDPQGNLVDRPVARVKVIARPGQRGLLGLTMVGADRLFAAWTRAEDGRLVIGEVDRGEKRIVWVGPHSADLANGGHLMTSPDGRLIVGIGDLQDRTKLGDPTAPNGKLLALDPDGPPGQRPTVLSSGWNNPFAFAYLADGTLWVADNAPGEQPERIGRGDEDGLPRTNLQGRRAPSALVALGPDRLGLCGYIDREMHDVRVAGDRAAPPGRAIVEPCSLGAAALPDGTLVTTTDHTVDVTTERIVSRATP